MILNDNGNVTREPTPEEKKAMEELAAQMPPVQPSEAERIAELEAKLKALEILTGEV